MARNPKPAPEVDAPVDEPVEVLDPGISDAEVDAAMGGPATAHPAHSAAGEVPRQPDDGAKTVPVQVFNGFWDGTVKHPKGSVVIMTVARARQILAEGKGQRMDPMPGESDADH